MPILHILIALFVSPQAWSYPEFIGYKYSSCLTCHFNGNGGGPLNDYGRALWSAEIAGRAFSGGKTEDQLGQSSGFFGSTELPFWIRPGLKMRDLEMESSPGSSTHKWQNILMQANANVAIFLDKDQRKGFVISADYIPEPLRIQNAPGTAKVSNIISREHYYRYQYSDSLWFYVGMFDKPYGIRIVDHTAFSRSKVGVAMNDQAHGVMMQVIKEKYEWSLDAYAGNMFQPSDVRQRGASTLFEYEVAPAVRVGFSGMYQTDNYVGETRFALHSRTGLGYGSAILVEGGIVRNSPKASNNATQGFYSYVELQQRLVRGYHLFLEGQTYKDNLSAGHDNLVQGGFGLLMFPMARTEFRLELQNGRQFNDDTDVQPESWTLLAQVHLSL